MNIFSRFYLLCLIITLTSSILIGQNEQSGFLSITNNGNLNIYIDSVLIANHSFENLPLKPGVYSIRYEYPQKYNWFPGYLEQTINIIPDSCIQLKIDREKLIKINSFPFKSSLFLGEQCIGTTPLLLMKDQYLSKALILKKNGYQNRRITITEKQDHYNIILDPLNEHTNSIVLKENYDKKYLHWNREGLIICSIITSWSAFLLKRQADRYYEKYETTTNPQLIDKYYDKTKNFDRYAEITFGASIISLCTYFYFLIK